MTSWFLGRRLTIEAHQPVASYHLEKGNGERGRGGGGRGETGASRLLTLTVLRSHLLIHGRCQALDSTRHLPATQAQWRLSPAVSAEGMGQVGDPSWSS